MNKDAVFSISQFRLVCLVMDKHYPYKQLNIERGTM